MGEDLTSFPSTRREKKEAETEGQPVESVTDLGCKEVRTAASLQRRTLRRWRLLPGVAGAWVSRHWEVSDTAEDSGYQRQPSPGQSQE